MVGFVLPDVKKVGYLDPEIAGEGRKVILSDGEQVSWNPPPANPVMPDWSKIKQIARYFGRTGYKVYPAWLYHPTEEPRLVKNAEEAAQLGICYRQATQDERGRYGRTYVWDWQDNCQWRPEPYHTIAFNPDKPQHGKNYQASPPNPIHAQNQLLEALVPAVAAAVAQSLKQSGPDKPVNIKATEWDEFLKFKAWQEAQSAVEKVSQEVAVAAEEQTEELVVVGEEIQVDESNALNTLSPEQELTLWRAEAERKGIKIDKRWGLARLKSEIEKAA